MSSTNNPSPIGNPSNYTTIQELPEDAKFNGENYVSWAVSMLRRAKLKGLHLYWEGQITIPTEPSNFDTISPTPISSKTPNYLEYEIRESVAYLTIWDNVKNPDSLGFPEGKKSHELWEFLQKEYTLVSHLARQRREDALRSCRYIAGDITGDNGYMVKFRTLRKQATDVGAKIEDPQFLTLFLDSFPRTPEWIPTVGALLTDPSVTFNVAAGRLQEHVRLMGGSGGETGIDGLDKTKALQTQVEELTEKVKALQASKKGPANPDLLCSNCKRRGDTIDNCFREGGGNLSTPTRLPNKLPIRIIADSGATHHFFKQRSYFHTYTSHNDKGGSSHEDAQFDIVGKGDVKVEMVHNGVVYHLLFRNAYHAPSISNNLLSTGVLDKLGWTALLGKGRMIFKDTSGEEKFEAILNSGVYVMDAKLVPHTPNTALAAQLPADIRFLHRAGGHIMPERIEMASGLVDGVPEVKGARKKMGTCEDCKRAHTDKQHHPESTEVVTEANFRWYLDIWGPAQVMSIGGNLYALFGSDAGTSRDTVDLLKDRMALTLVEKLEVRRSTAETQTGRKLKRIRTDNAPEWRSHAFKAWVESHGIIHEFTAPYTSPSNGVAERGIGAMLNGTRAMLFDAGLSAQWWGQAMSTYIYVKNILPNTKGIVPEEKWTGQRQNVSHLVPFGSIGFAHIPAKTGRGKLDVRGFKCQMVGYDGRKVYVVKRWESNEIYRTSDVAFEKSGGHWTSELEGENEDILFLAPTPKSVPSITDSIPDSTPPTPSSPSNPTNNEKTQLMPKAPEKRTRRTQAEIWGTAPTRSSARSRNLTQQFIESKEYEDREKEAHDRGEDWMRDSEEDRELLPEYDEEDSPTALKAQLDEVIEPDNTWVPHSYSEAMERPDLWMKPMEKELAKLDSRKAFTPVQRPRDAKIITTRWVYALRLDGNGKITERRARLVVRGYDQVKGIHYDDTWAIVARYESERFAIAIAAYEGMDLWSGDFTGAYLNARPQGVNYLALPEGFQERYSLRDGNNTVLLMNINIYGSMDAGNNWSNPADPCVRYRRTPLGSTITVTYTDDVTGVSTTEEDGKRARKEIAEQFEFRDYGEPDVVLGMTVRIHEDTGDVSLHQRPLIEKTLKAFGMTDCAAKHTPLSPGIEFIDSQPHPIPTSDKLFMVDKNYYSLIGALNHISQGTRPDIAFAVSLLQRYANDPRPIHWASALHLLASMTHLSVSFISMDILTYIFSYLTHTLISSDS
ncbi:hypothetical protein D9758_005121 [Tetrapyrgos nigripes]|uniref:Integrase catalytic domain-containing protein n=1 Tax=Tetrapyrgos nigripes TaxID=182062 RepID=A0A8H5GWP7_9AGAR|nr:hypothetical protein D9758_005121 [Tetrapyrgos nigripes]